eukprot:TRINITY_DN2773_c0_g1_i2.p1 TRINITY_DN2773_c0_g1~~TRINITY_DN2773_c0_g1_i2.p1  ORF type:complete len:456 (+),score=148.79 TRINITY_DN2773_c0_g1_i2:77-1444(+)
MSHPQYDAIVVGGGIAGVKTAVTLRSNGCSVLLLEARDRLGGRTCSVEIEGYWFDTGGQWVGGTHTLLRQTCDRLGIATFPQNDDGKHVLELNNNLQFYDGNISTISGLEGINEAIAKIDEFAATLDPSSPYSAPRAKEWDRQTLGEWLNANVSSAGAKLLIIWFSTVCLTCEPHEISFLFFLLFIRSAGSYALLADIKGGAQQDRIIGGSQQVSEKLATLLPPSSILLRHPVRSIHQDHSGVRVMTDSDTFTARYVVVAVPPTLAGRINYAPPMPPARDELTQRYPMGTVIKTIVIYDKPFWREKGFSAEAISDKGPIFICYDDSSHDDKRSAIVGFIAGDAAREWAKQPYEIRRRAVLQCYARWWGEQALTPNYYLEKDWKTEEWSRGCYLGVTSPGTITAVGHALRTPVGRIHWAGTETASRWIGYMEGALDSGERAAGEVLNCLHKLPSRL